MAASNESENTIIIGGASNPATRHQVPPTNADELAIEAATPPLRYDCIPASRGEMTASQYRAESRGWNMRQSAYLAVIPGALALAAARQFGPWIPQVFFGDDLANYLAQTNGTFAGNLSQMLFGEIVDKYRPVYQLIIGGFFLMFRDNYAAYLLVCFTIHISCALVVFIIAMRLSHSAAVAFAVSVAFATLRFAYFNLTATGLVESLALLFLLGALQEFVGLFEEEPPGSPAMMALRLIGFETLAIFTHERYLAIVPWVMLVVLLAPGTGGRGRRISLALVALLPAVLNLSYKQFVIHTSLVEGTGAQPLTLDVLGSLDRLSQAILSALGLNTGPAYLVGHEITSLTDPALWLAAGFMASALAALWVGRWWHAPPLRLHWAWLTILLAGLLLIPPMMTIRMEQRWILAPAMIMLLLLAWVVGLKRNRALVSLAITGLLFFLANNIAISGDFAHMYLLSAANYATALSRSNVIPVEGRIDLLADSGFCDWVLQSGDFFKVYGGHSRDVACFATEDAWRQDHGRSGRLLKYDPIADNFSTIGE